MKPRPKSTDWAGHSPKGFEGVGAIQPKPFVVGWVSRGGGQCVCVCMCAFGEGAKRKKKKKKSNAMSHSTLAAGEGERDKG